MGRAPSSCLYVGACLSDNYIVSFRYCVVKSFRLKYQQMYGETSDKRTYHLDRLRQHRNRRGLTQMELAKLSGVGRATIAGLEASDPTKGSQRGAYRSTVEKLAKALKVKPHELGD